MAEGEKTHAHEPVTLDGSFLPVAFRQKTKQVARDIVQYVCRREDADKAPNRACSIMRDLVDDALAERGDFMRGLVSRLDLKERGELELINEIASAMFDDELVNWGRIVTLHAFCAFLARHCEEGPFPDCADDIALILNSIMTNRLGLWVVTNGGWASLEKQFPKLFWMNAGGVWKGLLLVGMLIVSVIVFYSSVRYMNNGYLPF